MKASTRIAILHPSDPAGNIPGGIDSIIKGLVKWAPADLDYTVFGATSDPEQRPIGQVTVLDIGGRPFRFVPVISVHQSRLLRRMPLTVRYVVALRKFRRSRELSRCDILDFHRVEPAVLFRSDSRAKNILIHTDYAALRGSNSDILWRHWPSLYERLEAPVLHTMDCVFSVSHSAIDRYAKEYPTIAARLSFTPTWFDSEIFRPLSDPNERTSRRTGLLTALSAPGDFRLITFVGRLERGKNPSLLLDSFEIALHRRRDLHLVLIGDGSLRGMVEERCKSLPLLGHVSVLGPCPPARIAHVLQGSDLFVLTSEYEGMPIAALEALAAGVPVVSTDVGELRNIIHDGVDGRISRDTTAAALADAICEVLSENGPDMQSQCLIAAEPFEAKAVLSRFYENHRRQGRDARGRPLVATTKCETVS